MEFMPTLTMQRTHIFIEEHIVSHRLYYISTIREVFYYGSKLGYMVLFTTLRRPTRFIVHFILKAELVVLRLAGNDFTCARSSFARYKN